MEHLSALVFWIIFIFQPVSSSPGYQPEVFRWTDVETDCKAYYNELMKARAKMPNARFHFSNCVRIEFHIDHIQPSNETWEQI